MVDNGNSTLAIQSGEQHLHTHTAPPLVRLRLLHRSNSSTIPLHRYNNDTTGGRGGSDDGDTFNAGNDDIDDEEGASRLRKRPRLWAIGVFSDAPTPLQRHWRGATNNDNDPMPIE